MKGNILCLKDLFERYKTRLLSTWQLFQKMFNVLDDIVNKYNNTVHRTIKRRLIEVPSGFYAECSEDDNEKDPKFKVADRVRISKYKKLFAKGYMKSWSELFIISKIKNTVPWTYFISDFNGEKIDGRFYEKELQKSSQENLESKK